MRFHKICLSSYHSILCNESHCNLSHLYHKIFPHYWIVFLQFTDTSCNISQLQTKPEQHTNHNLPLIPYCRAAAPLIYPSLQQTPPDVLYICCFLVLIFHSVLIISTPHNSSERIISWSLKLHLATPTGKFSVGSHLSLSAALTPLIILPLSHSLPLALRKSYPYWFSF